MLNQKDKLQRFVQVVEKNAEDKCNEINAYVQQTLESQLEQISKKYSDELCERLDAESRKIKTEINRKITAIAAEDKKIVAAHKNSISDRVFDCVRERLGAFCQGEDYLSYLEHCLDKIGGVCPGESEIFVRASDTEKIEALAEKYSFVRKVTADDSIVIGGMIAVSLDGSLRIDCTLGYELEQSMEWFRANCFCNV